MGCELPRLSRRHLSSPIERPTGEVDCATAQRLRVTLSAGRTAENPGASDGPIPAGDTIVFVSIVGDGMAFSSARSFGRERSLHNMLHAAVIWVALLHQAGCAEHFVQQPQGGTVSEGESFTMTCQLAYQDSGSSCDNYRFYWYKFDNAGSSAAITIGAFILYPPNGSS